MSNKSTDTDNLLNRQHMCSDPMSFNSEIFNQGIKENKHFKSSQKLLILKSSIWKWNNIEKDLATFVCIFCFVYICLWWLLKFEENTKFSVHSLQPGQGAQLNWPHPTPAPTTWARARLLLVGVSQSSLLIGWEFWREGGRESTPSRAQPAVQVM